MTLMVISGTISNEVKYEYDFLCEELDRYIQRDGELAKQKRRAEELHGHQDEVEQKEEPQVFAINHEEAKEEEDDKNAGVAIIDGDENEDADILGDKETKKDKAKVWQEEQADDEPHKNKVAEDQI